MILPLLLLAQAATPAAGPPAPAQAERHARCVEQATRDPARAEADAAAWRLAGGGFLARQCLGLAYASQQRWAAAADAFEDAGRTADVAKDERAANYWAQAGNAWLAGGDAKRARAAIDAALTRGTLKDLALGEAHLDRARILVAGSDPAGARADLDLALKHAAADPLAWLLSATLARRGGDLPTAQAHIAQALERSADDASVQLEAGNIAATAGDAAAARTAWERVVAIAPAGPQAASARAALAQFGATPPAPPPPPPEGR